MIPASIGGNTIVVGDTTDKIREANGHPAIDKQSSMPLQGLVSGGQQSIGSAADMPVIWVMSAVCVMSAGLNAAERATGSNVTEIAMKTANIVRAKVICPYACRNMAPWGLRSSDDCATKAPLGLAGVQGCGEGFVHRCVDRLSRMPALNTRHTSRAS
jgi:hypothetical protein